MSEEKKPDVSQQIQAADSKIQQVYERHLARLEAQKKRKAEHHAAIQIQALFRAHKLRAKFMKGHLERKRSATKIQAMWRGHLVRKQQRMQQPGAVAAPIPSQATISMREEEDAASKIQALYAGHKARKEADEEREKREDAARKIQQVYRKHSSRKFVQQQPPGYRYAGAVGAGATVGASGAYFAARGDRSSGDYAEGGYGEGEGVGYEDEAVAAHPMHPPPPVAQRDRPGSQGMDEEEAASKIQKFYRQRSKTRSEEAQRHGPDMDERIRSRMDALHREQADDALRAAGERDEEVRIGMDEDESLKFGRGDEMRFYSQPSDFFSYRGYEGASKRMAKAPLVGGGLHWYFAAGVLVLGIVCLISWAGVWSGAWD
eukprot:TRINITY_DN34356_c0_g1_i1.p1 TRINITY_DN34356_c0_g1~~TRINITY_DN34356_c0_g1_i1.p1  ORF type:complete len:383 (-),score=99.59 TRINITY_DN34356_c0_g1_i1:50-1171(-)